MNSTEVERNSIVAELEEILNQNGSGPNSQYEIFRNNDDKEELLSRDCIHLLKEIGIDSSFNYKGIGNSKDGYSSIGKLQDLSPQFEQFLQLISDFEDIDWLTSEECTEETEHSDHSADVGDSFTARERVLSIKLASSPFQSLIDHLKSSTSAVQQIFPSLALVTGLQKSKTNYKFSRKDRRRERRDNSGDNQHTNSKHGSKSKFLRKKDRSADETDDPDRKKSSLHQRQLDDIHKRRLMEQLSVCCVKSFAEGSEVALLTILSLLFYHLREVNVESVDTIGLYVGNFLSACFEHNLSKNPDCVIPNPFEVFAPANAPSKRTRSNSMTNSELSRQHFAVSSDAGDESQSRDDNISQVGHFGGGTSDAGSSTMGGGSSIFTHSLGGGDNSVFLRDDLNDEDMLAQAIALSMGEGAAAPSNIDEILQTPLEINVAAVSQMDYYEEDDRPENDIIDEAENDRLTATAIPTPKPPHPFSSLGPFACSNFWTPAPFTSVLGVQTLNKFQNNTVPIRHVICSLMAIVLSSMVDRVNGDGIDHVDPSGNGSLHCHRTVTGSGSLSSLVESLALLEFIISIVKQLIRTHCEWLRQRSSSENQSLLQNWFIHFYFLSWCLNSALRLTTELLSSVKDITTSFGISLTKSLKVQILELLDESIIELYGGTGSNSHHRGVVTFLSTHSAFRNVYHQRLCCSPSGSSFMFNSTKDEGENWDKSRLLIDYQYSPWVLLHDLRLSSLRALSVVLMVNNGFQQRIELLDSSLRNDPELNLLKRDEVKPRSHCFCSLQEIAQFVATEILSHAASLCPVIQEVQMLDGEYYRYFIHYLCIHFIKLDPLFSKENSKLANDKEITLQFLNSINGPLIKSLIMTLLKRCVDTRLANNRVFPEIPARQFDTKPCNGELIVLQRLQQQLFECCHTEHNQFMLSKYAKRSLLLQFHSMKSHSSLTISENSTVVNHVGPKVWSSIVASVGFPVNSGTYEISLRIDRCSKGHIFVGLVSEDFAVEKDAYIGVDRHSWGLIGTRSLWHNKSKAVSDYGQGFSSNSTITLVYDSNKGVLSFRSSVTSASEAAADWGVAFDTLPRKLLYIACSLHEKGDKITLLSCNHHSSGGSIATQAAITSFEGENEERLMLENIASFRPPIEVLPKARTEFWLQLLLDYGKLLLFFANDILQETSIVQTSLHPVLGVLLPSFLASLLTSQFFILMSSCNLERMSLICTFFPSILTLQQKLKGKSLSISSSKELEKANIICIAGLWDMRIVNHSGSMTMPENFHLNLQTASVSNTFIEKQEEFASSPSGDFKDFRLYDVEFRKHHAVSSSLSMIGLQSWNRCRIFETFAGESPTIDIRISLCGSHLVGRYFDVKSEKVYRIEGARAFHPQDSRPSSTVGQLLFRLALIHTLVGSRIASALVLTNSVFSPHPRRIDLTVRPNQTNDTDEDEMKESDPAYEDGDGTQREDSESPITLNSKVASSVISGNSKIINADGVWLESDLFSGGYNLTAASNREKLCELLNNLVSPFTINLPLFDSHAQLADEAAGLAPMETDTEDEFITSQFNVWAAACCPKLALNEEHHSQNVHAEMNLFLRNLLNAKINTQVLDDYLFLHIGSSGILKSKLGGAIVSYTRRAVLVSLIRHSGIYPTCHAIFDDLTKNLRDITERPPQILCDVWKASIKVLETIVRLKQESGVAYEIICRSICLKTELLDELFLSDAALMILEDLQLLEHSNQISDKWYAEQWSHKLLCNKLVNEIAEFVVSATLSLPTLRKNLFERNLSAIFRTMGYYSFLQLIGKEKNAQGKELESSGSSSIVNSLNAVTLQYLGDGADGFVLDELSERSNKFGLIVHYAHNLQSCSTIMKTSLRVAFERLYSAITHLLSRSIWNKDRSLQVNCLLCWNIFIEPTEHLFLNQIDLFRVLHTVLDELRTDLSTSATISSNPLASGIKIWSEGTIAKLQFVSRVALATVYSLAAQIASSGEGNDAKNAFAMQYGLRKAPSGPDTLSKSLFDLIYAELFNAVKLLVEQAFPDVSISIPNEAFSEGKEQANSHVSNRTKEACDYIYRVLRLLGFVADSKVCSKILVCPKWISLFLAIIGVGNMEIQRRIVRLMQKLLTNLDPKHLVAFIPKALVFRELFRLEFPVDDDDITDLIESYEQAKENSAELMIEFFLECVGLSVSRFEELQETLSVKNSELLESVAAEVMFLFRVLLGIPVWRKFILEEFSKRLSDYVKMSVEDQHAEPIPEIVRFISIASILGGSIEKRRVGGFVTIRPFALLGTADNYATKLAAASHSTGLLVGVSSVTGTAEVVLMERSSRASFNSNRELSVTHAFNIAGSLPVRSIRLPLHDVMPCSDVPFYPFQISSDIIHYFTQYLTKISLPLLKSTEEWLTEKPSNKVLLLHTILFRSLAGVLQHDRSVDTILSALPFPVLTQLLNLGLTEAEEYGLSGIEAYCTKLMELESNRGRKTDSPVFEAPLISRNESVKEPAAIGSTQSPLRELASILAPFGRRTVDQATQQASLSQMLEIGLPREWCEFALKRTNYNVEMAINLCLEHGSEMNQIIAQEAMVETVQTQRETAVSSSSSSARRILQRESNRREEREDPHVLIRQLLEMGFPPSWCARAMESTQNNLDAALGWILTHDEELLSSNEGSGVKADNSEEVVNTKSEEMEVGQVARNPLTVISGSCQFKSDLTCTCSHNTSGFPSIGCRSYPVKSGKWYYELTVVTAGCVQVGWANTSFTGKSDMGQGVGDDACSWAYDGWRNYIWHETNAEWGAKWAPGDVVGCAIDFDTNEMLFSLNGCWEELGMGVAFQHFCDTDSFFGGMYPCVSFNKDEKVRFNFGSTPFHSKIPDGFRPYIARVENPEECYSSVSSVLSSLPWVKTDAVSEDTVVIEDAYEEFLLEKNSIQKRYFTNDEAKPISNNDAINFFTARSEERTDHFAQDFRKLSRYICVLYSRLFILRILRRIGKYDHASFQLSPFSDAWLTWLSDSGNLQGVFRLLKLVSSTTTRTKVFYYIMKILPPNFAIPSNIGPIFCVGGPPVLAELTHTFQLIFQLELSSSKHHAVEAAIDVISRNSVEAAKREYTELWIIDSMIPYIPRDVQSPELSDISKPSLVLSAWLTSVLCLSLRNCVKMGNVSVEQFFPPIINSWLIPLCSPLVAIKGYAVKMLNTLYQEFSSCYSVRNHHAVHMFGRKRIELRCLESLNYERSTEHCSDLLQGFLELDAYLENQELIELGIDEDERLNSNFSLMLENEEEHEDPWYNWEAMTGRCLIDTDGWQVFSGCIKLEPIPLPHQPLSGTYKISEKRDAPPALLPGCKVCRGRKSEGEKNDDSSIESTEQLSPKRLSEKLSEEGDSNYRIGTVEAVSSWPNEDIRGTARVIRWDDNDELELVRWGAEGLYDVIHVAVKNNKVAVKYPHPPTVWQKIGLKFGLESSFGFILRVRHGLDKLRVGHKVLVVMEWPDFCAASSGFGTFDSEGHLFITEDKLLRGPLHSGWEQRFGTPYWQRGTIITLKCANRLCEDRYSSALTGRSEFSASMFSRVFPVYGSVQLQEEHLFQFDDRYRVSNITLSVDRLSASKATNSGQGCAIGTVGFSSGLHYWEFKIEQAEAGSVFIGITEKPIDAKNLRLSRWTGCGFVNNRSSYRATEQSNSPLTDRAQVYGDHFHSGDLVGVILDLNKGKLSFFLDGMKYGEHILSDLGEAFDNLYSPNTVKPRTYFPIVGLNKALDRVTLTPRWFSTIGADAKEELVLYRRVYQLFSTWSLDRSSQAPLQQHLWIYREAWRHFLLWRKGSFVRTQTRCKVTNLQFVLNISTEECVLASIRLGLVTPLLVGDRIQFSKSSGRRLDLKEEAIILGCYRGNLWFKLEAQSGSTGNQMEGGNNAWYLVPSDVDGLRITRRSADNDPVTSVVHDVVLPKIPSYFGGFVLVIHESGAVMRDGLEIDTSEVICTIPANTRVFAVEQRINASNIRRFYVAYEEKFGWISERMRGGSEEVMLRRVRDVVQSEVEELKQLLRPHIDEQLQKKLKQVECSTVDEAINLWKSNIREVCPKYEPIVHRPDIECDFNTFVLLSSTVDGNAPWTVEADMQLAELISKSASQLNIDPYNLRVSDFKSSIEISQENPQSALHHIELDRVVARASILRVANLLFTQTLPYLPLKLPEETNLLEATGQDCVFELLPAFAPRNDSSLEILDFIDQSNINQLEKFWNPPCFARRVRSLRRLLFTQTKLSFWEHVLNESTTPTALPQDEYEDPREIKTIRVNRIKATLSHLTAIKNPFDRIKQSVFGQLHKEIRGWPNPSYRRSYIGKGHGGQKRAFKVKFVGEGVNDYGGPYRAVFEQVADELRVDCLSSSNSKIVEKCLLPLLLPCPNRTTGAGANQDNYILATGSTVTPMNQELMSFLGRVVGLGVRHHLNMKLDLSTLVWRPLVRLPLAMAHLESVDSLSSRNLLSVIELGSSLEQSKDIYPLSYQPEEWSELSFTTYLADGTRIPLIPGGEQVPVTLGNWKEYVRLNERSRLMESYVMFKALREGLISVLPGELFPLFTSSELEQLICGSGYVDIDLIRRYTEYEDLDPNSALVEQFWQVLAEMSDEERTLFLRFVWARSRMPSSKEFPMNFKLQKAQGVPREQMDLHLPRAQTCFFSLALPSYSTKEIMKDKLLYAIKNSPNMDADVRLHTAEGWGDS